MIPKRIQYYKTYEETLNNCKRYIDIICQRMNQDEHFDDMRAAAMEGLWLAYTRYNVDDERPFHQYAIVYIRGYVMRYLTTFGRIIKIPAHIQKKEDFYENKTISTNQTINEETNSTIGDMIESDEIEYWDGEELIEDDNNQNKILLRYYLLNLKDQHQQIITMYYAQDMTLQMIAEKLNITREAVRQQLDGAINKLQKQFGVEIEKIIKPKRYNKKLNNKRPN